MDNFNNQNLQGTIKKFSVAKIIFIILGLVLLGEVIYAVKVLTVPAPLPVPVRRAEIKPTVGKISLSTPKTSFRVGEVMQIVASIDSGGNTVDGVDLVIKYNPKVLEATPGGLIKGKIFDEYPFLSVDSDKGLISISGISSLGNNFKGSGQFAVINFKAKALGTSSLVVDFTKDSTADSNMVEAGTSKDILEVVNNLSLTVQ